MSNEFSTPKLTPADNVKIPGVDGNDSGYLLSEEVKDYMVGGVYGETEEYSTLETYTVGQRVKNEGDLYRCTTAVAVPEVFDPTKWKKIDLPSLDEGVLNAETNVAAVRGTTDGYKESGKAYEIGDPCIQDNIVYVAKEAIADPAGAFDPTKWDQSDLVTLMLKAKENSEAISSLMNQSYSEQLVGKDADGNNLYRKCYKGTLGSTVPYKVDPTFTNVLYSTKMVLGSLRATNNAELQIGMYINSNNYSGIFMDSSGLNIYFSSSLSGCAFYLVVYYTKLT